MSAPSRQLHLPLPAEWLAHGFSVSTACLHSVSHTPSPRSLSLFFHQLALRLRLLPSCPSSLTHSFLYVLAWQHVLIGKTALSLGLKRHPICLSCYPFFPLLAVLPACLRWQSAHVWKDEMWQRPDNTPMAVNSQNRERCKMKTARCSQVAENHYKRNLTFKNANLISDKWKLEKPQKKDMRGENTSLINNWHISSVKISDVAGLVWISMIYVY